MEKIVEKPNTKSHDGSHSSGRIQSLDGLRALSITMVLIDHLGFAASKNKVVFLLARLFGNGYLAVSIFFVISGFLITTLLLKEKEKYGGISLRDFYLRRAIRIWPVFYVMLIVLGILGSLHVIAHIKDIWMWTSALFCSNYNMLIPTFGTQPGDILVRHTWSLSCEEQFYLLWPFVLAFSPRKVAVKAAIAIICLEPVVRTIFYCSYPALRPAILFLGFTRADFLMFGCLAALMKNAASFDGFLRSAWSKNAHVYAALFVFVISELIVLACKTKCVLYWSTVGMTLDGAAVTLILLWAIDCREGLTIRLLNARPVVFLGAISYSLYLWQEPFLMYHTSSPLTKLPLNIIGSLLVALASYYVIEKPFLSLKKFLPARN